MAITKVNQFRLFILILSLVFFLPFLGTVHLLDWDEVNFAESSREMIMSGNYFNVQINFQTFWEKPPFFFWVQSLSMHLFGINEFAARFPNALCGIITLLVLFEIGRKEVSIRFAAIWVMIYFGTLLTHFYFKTGIIDPWFNLFIFLSLYFIYRRFALGEFRKGLPMVLLSGLFSGLALLTKGPVAIIVIGLSIGIFMLFKFKEKTFEWRDVAVFTGINFIISFGWFGVEFIQNGPFFLREFIVYQIRLMSTQDAGHGGPFFYHWVAILIGCFPTSVFALQAFYKRTGLSITSTQEAMRLLMKISFFVVLILFSLVKTKIVHYSSFTYFPLTFLAAWVLLEWWEQGIKWHFIERTLFLLLAWALSMALVIFPMLMLAKGNWLPGAAAYIKDPFALACLRTPVEWGRWEVLPGLILFLGTVMFVRWSKSKPQRALPVLYLSTAITLQLSLLAVVPKIEQYIQGEMVAFFQEKAKEGAYVKAIGFKSYAQYYYGEVNLERTRGLKNWDSLLVAGSHKPIYTICKFGKTKKMDEDARFERIGGQYGFVFYQFKPE